MRHVERIAQAPRPPGTQAHARAVEMLTAELASLGLQPQVQETVAVRQRGNSLTGARVRNILARLPGTESGPAVLLVAHYDSRSTTRGAGDDMAGVAAILETLRALRAGSALGQDLIVLFSDAEEVGLLGARAFADQHPWMADVGLVMNFEGRGNRRRQHDVRERRGVWRAGARAARRCAVSVRQFVGRGGVSANAERHGLLGFPRCRCTRLELRVHRRLAGLPLGFGYPGTVGSAQRAAPRFVRAGADAAFRAIAI